MLSPFGQTPPNPMSRPQPRQSKHPARLQERTDPARPAALTPRQPSTLPCKIRERFAVVIVSSNPAESDGNRKQVTIRMLAWQLVQATDHEAGF